MSDSKKLNFSVREIMPGTPECDEMDKNLDFGRQWATDQADRYTTHHRLPFTSPLCKGRCVLDVLPFLWGKPWDNMAENFLASLRPSSVRVTTGEVTCDASTWRVTVYLEEDERTIRRIEQEVDVGLTGCRYGADLKNYASGHELPQHTPLVIINPRALAKLQLDIKK